jgi:anaerobic dimethyl sulfoxide reductase subunit B (iron-sulfur subunit)
MTCPFGTPQYDDERGVMSKCHLCTSRVDAGRPPACVAACPTKALRFAAPAADLPDGAARFVPGFVDPAQCKPSLSFLPPANARRAELFRSLEEALRR